MLSIFFNSISICGLSSRLFLRKYRELILASRSSVFWRILCSVCFVANCLLQSPGRLITSKSFGLVDIPSLIVSHCESQNCGLRSVGRSLHPSSKFTPDFKIHMNMSLIIQPSVVLILAYCNTNLWPWEVSNKPTSNCGNRVVVYGTHGLPWIFDHRKIRDLGTSGKLSSSPTNSYGLGVIR